MLKAEIKQLNQRRKAPQICFKENCTFFFRYIPKQLHAVSLICCAYSIKCSAFYNVCLCWSLSERGLGTVQCGKGCCAGKHCETQYHTQPCDPSPYGKSIAASPVGGTCVTVADGHLNSETSSGESSMWAILCKESVHSQGNNGAALLNFEQRCFFLGQGGG